MAGVAVALSAARFATRRFDASALLRCLGLSRHDALLLYILQLGMLGLLASLVGALLGWTAQHGLFYLLRDLLAQDIPRRHLARRSRCGHGSGGAGGLCPSAIGRTGSRTTIAGTAPRPVTGATRAWLVYGTAILALGLIMWRLSLDLKITLALLGGGLLATLVLGGLLLLGLKGMRRLLAGASLSWRLGLGQLLRHPLAAAGQALAFGLILLAMALIALLRGELLDTWQDQLPDDAPNHFVLNVLPAERMPSPSESTHSPAMPRHCIRWCRADSWRSMASRSASWSAKESQGERAIRRDLSLTWSADLPKDNHLVAGQWWHERAEAELPGVSVEAELAESLQLKLGDQLSFTIGGLTREARVTSLREVNWDSFQPNFYMIFEPDTLQGMPATYMTSFHLPPGNERELVELARAFPSVTLLQVEALLAQLRSILAQVSLAVEYVLLFVLAAGLAVLFAGLQATLDERIRQGALLRARGRTASAAEGAPGRVRIARRCQQPARRAWLRTGERPALSLCVRPALAAASWLLLMPLIGALLVGSAGLIGTRRALNASPLSVLREN